MAKAALENALWDAEAAQKQLPLWKLLGGTRREIPCGVSIGIQDSIEQLLEKIQIELSAGYRRIKVKVKPGWDVNVLERIRSRWADITLSCDANSAYTLDQVEHLRKLDQFNLLMIEQPLWNDDIYYHARLQKELRTSICLDESIVSVRSAAFAVETNACRIINVKVGRVGGFSEALKIHDLCQAHNIPVWCGGMLETGIGRSQNIALSTLENFSLPGDVSASKRYWKEDIIEPEVEVSPQGMIAISDRAGNRLPRERRSDREADRAERNLTSLNSPPRAIAVAPRLVALIFPHQGSLYRAMVACKAHFFALQQRHSFSERHIVGQSLEIAEHFVGHDAEALDQQDLPIEVQTHFGDLPESVSHIGFLNPEMPSLVETPKDSPPKSDIFEQGPINSRQSLCPRINQ